MFLQTRRLCLGLLIFCATACLALPSTGCRTHVIGEDGAPDPNAPPKNIGSGKTTIGVILPLTGEAARYGRDCMQGIALAMDENTVKGGPALGLKLSIEDDCGNPKLAHDHLNHLVKNEGAVAILGPATSNCVASAAMLAQKLSIPLITPSATNYDITQAGDSISRVCYIDPMQGYVMAAFAVNNLGKKRGAIVFEEDSTYSTGLAKAFEQAYKALGGEILHKSSYAAGEKEFKKTVADLKALAPDVVFVPGLYKDVAEFAKALRAAGTHERLLTLIGGDGWDAPELVSLAGSALNESFFCTHFSPYEKDAWVADFVKAYQKKYRGETPSTWAALGFDAAMMLLNAVGRAGGTDPRRLKDAINTTREFVGVTGLITLDENRNPLKSAVIMKITGGNVVYETRVSFSLSGH
ncbi:MAG: ABC transporter substrate-binding protein [Planctomycetota bacterium]|nr:ABC transporter substrate-binding protein [Planctomycetota bacterium]